MFRERAHFVRAWFRFFLHVESASHPPYIHIALARLFRHAAMLHGNWSPGHCAGTTHKERLTSQASEFSKTFREEMKKGMDQQFSGKDGPQGRR